MAYGLRVRDAGGAIILDTSDRITRNAYISAQTAENGNSGELSQLSGKSSAEFCVPVNVPDAHGTAHLVYRGGNVIYWQVYDTPWLNPATCVIFSFLYT